MRKTYINADVITAHKKRTLDTKVHRKLEITTSGNRDIKWSRYGDVGKEDEYGYFQVMVCEERA